MDFDEQDFVILGDKDVEDFNDAGLLPQSPENIRKIQQWLQPTDYSAESSEYGKHLASYVAGTGTWIEEAEEFKKWHDSPGYGALWIKAIPGAGKSVFAALLASKFATTEKVPVLCFFFRQIITTNQKPQSMVRDWLSQLLSYSPFLQSKLKKLLDDSRTLGSVALDELWQTLQSALALLPRVYCVADALDEMNMGNEPFLNQLIQLGQHSPSSIKVLMTSRPVPRIEKILKSSSVLQITLQQQLVDPGIVIYMDHRLKDANIPEDTRSTIRHTLCSKAQGLFLYARLMMDDLLDLNKHNLTDKVSMQNALDKLPSCLADMYNGMLRDHSDHAGVPQELQLTILQWVTHSERPLRLLELASIIDFQQTAKGKSQDTKSIVRAGCGPLLEILEDETVCVIHHSFTEFLIDAGRHRHSSEKNSICQFPSLDFTTTHRAIAFTCINYLTSSWLDDWEIRPMRPAAKSFTHKHTSQTIRLKHPFLEYAATNWHHHVSKYDKADKDLFSVLDGFMTKESKAFSSWLDLTRPNKQFHKLLPIHVAAYKGLNHYMVHLMQLGQDIESLDHNSRTPIFHAAIIGHDKVATTLLKHGAKNDLDDCCGLKPLHHAARANHFAVVKLLLESGVDPFAPKTKDTDRWRGPAGIIGETAVEYACQFGHLETVREFMAHLQPDGLDTALYWAARFGKTEVVSVLLESPEISINSIRDGQTPVFLAAVALDLVSMRAVLNRGADINIKCNYDSSYHGPGSTDVDDTEKLIPLHAFSRSCQGRSCHKKDGKALKAGFKTLLQAGCDINAADPDGRSALHYLVESCTSSDARPWAVEIISFLLDQGANPSAAANDGSHPLHLLRRVPGSVVRLLVQHGADINARLPDGKSPLMRSLQIFERSISLALLAHGADCHATDQLGQTPLHVAVRKPRTDKEVIEALLHAGANPNARDKNGDSPLHSMIGRDSRDYYLSLLIEAKADLEARNDAGLTVFLKIVHGQWNFETIQRLIAAGADVNACDFSGATAMHLACQTLSHGSAAKLLGFLVSSGVDPMRTDYAGNTLLHEAARKPPDRYQDELIELLETILELGISPSAKNNEGQTAVHNAARIQQESDYPMSPLEFLLGPRCNIDANVADNNGVRPIHLAAKVCESTVARLLKAGADPTVLTVEDQSPLMVACQARQSNIVGLLVDVYIEQGQSRFVDHTDVTGRTALHWACRSGRCESVQILLDAGASPNQEDKRGLTPHDACGEFREDDTRWPLTYMTHDGLSYVDAASVLLRDSLGPREPRYEYEVYIHRRCYGICSDIDAEHDTLGVRQSIRLLARHSADVAALISGGSRTYYHGRSDSFDVAISAGCEAMVDGLLTMTENTPATPEESKQTLDDRGYLDWKEFAEHNLARRSKNIPDLLEGRVNNGKGNTEVLWRLLRRDNERGLEYSRRLRADLFKPAEWCSRSQCTESCLTTLARWGFYSIMEKVLTQASMVDNSWIQEEGADDPNLRDRLWPILRLACERELPNIETIKVLVEKCGVDVNLNDRRNYYQSSALHILAKAQYWWQPKAIEYLILRGADMEIKNYAGDTPLHSAVTTALSQGYMRSAAVEVLLRHGANPNTLDGNGRSCLSKAGLNPECVRQLIKYGASITIGEKPFIFEVIKAMDFNILSLLTESGADCNARKVCDKEKMDHAWTIGHNAESKDLSDTSYPIHFAACDRFNTAESKSKMIPIIEALLKGGANPFLLFNGEDSILHNLAESGGILEPFLDLPTLDLEARDSQGRTLLLVNCCFSGYGPGKEDSSGEATRLLVNKGADITAVDNRGRNALHCILDSHKHYEDTPQSFSVLLSQPQGSNLAVQKDASGTTPLHYALRMNTLSVIDALLSRGAVPLEPDPNGDSALHHLARIIFSDHVSRQMTHFQNFLARGAPINARNKLGETPLFNYMACGSGSCQKSSHREKLPLFTDAGADLFARNKKGEGLLHVLGTQSYPRSSSAEEDVVDIFKYLMDKRLDPMMEDEEQRTSLDVAAACENTAILELFQRKV
ncbi:hypothetical protein MMC24_003449 [Lignoscripta atroalba]|nr:hypothetical protein [Lignoscripta atroalba]